MAGKYTTLEFRDFMDAFFPKSQAKKSYVNAFREVPDFASERSMYTWIVNTLNGSGLFSNHKFIATPYKADPTDDTKQAVDCGMYRTALPPLDDEGNEDKEETHNRRNNWSRVEIPIECKVKQTTFDPFDDGDKENPESSSADRKNTLGQILSYAELVFKHQHRTCLYMVLFLGHMARIVRFDRSGVFVTAKFDYKSEGELLTEFLQRYGRLGDKKRGFDTTAERIEAKSALGQRMVAFGRKKAEKDPEDYVQQMFNESLDESWPWWKLEVHEERPDPERPGRMRVDVKTFLVGKPHFQAPGIACRGTRGYVAVAFDEKDELGDLSYMKDAWRVDHPGLEQEGSVLSRLNGKKIPFVPTLLCHGDLPDQVTKSQDVWQDVSPQDQPTPPCHLRKHRHYRLIVKEVGKSLSEFDRGLLLIKAIWCVLYAHSQAYKQLGIIHGDISSGNILLYKDNGKWFGLLNDWELSKQVRTGDTPPIQRQPNQTGTWQFMSVHALNDPAWEITIEDEIESCFHVLLYYAVRFLPHNLKSHVVSQFLANYFDGYTYTAQGHRCGLTKSSAMRYGRILVHTYNGNEVLRLQFYRSHAADSPERAYRHPINAIVEDFLDRFRAYYSCKSDMSRNKRRSRPSPREEDQNELRELLRLVNRDVPSGEIPAKRDICPTTNEEDVKKAASLSTHEAALAMIEHYMLRAGWPKNDKGPDTELPQGLPHRPNLFAPVHSTRKRARDEPAPSSSKRSRHGGSSVQNIPRDLPMTLT